MSEDLPNKSVRHCITNSTEFMLPFYLPYVQYYAPSSSARAVMEQMSMCRSLVAALRGCPLASSRVKIHPDKSVWLEYDPKDPNCFVIEFQDSQLSYGELEASGFSLTLLHEHNLVIPPLDGRVSASGDSPLLNFKVSHLRDGGVVLYCLPHHLLFDGMAIFCFIAHWAKCHRALAQSPNLPPEIQPIPMALVSNTDELPGVDPEEVLPNGGCIFEDPTTTATACRCVFSLSMATLQRMKQEVTDSGCLGDREWVTSNTVMAAFIAQHVAQANFKAGNSMADKWSIFLTADARRFLDLPLQGIGSPLYFFQHYATSDELADPAQFPMLARSLRQSVAKHSNSSMQAAMNWVDATYKKLAASGDAEPWRHFNYTMLVPGSRFVGISCMNKMPIYDADFGFGRPKMADSLNNVPNYIIVFPGPPVDDSLEHDTLHMHMVLRKPAMDALQADPEWNKVCTPIGAPCYFED